MICSFHPEAEAEFLEAIDYYEERSRGLGNALAMEVYSALARIIAHPKAWPIVEGKSEDVLRADFHTASCILMKPDTFMFLLL